jgi:hypothetical protein
MVMKMLGAVGWMEACSPSSVFLRLPWSSFPKLLLVILLENEDAYEDDGRWWWRSEPRRWGFFSCVFLVVVRLCVLLFSQFFPGFSLSPPPGFFSSSLFPVTPVFLFPFSPGSVSPLVLWFFFVSFPPVRSSPLFLFEETRGYPTSTPFLFLLSPLSSRFFLVLSSLRMPCGPVLSVFNAGVKAAVFFFSGEEDEQCWGYFAFWSLMFWTFCNQALG